MKIALIIFLLSLSAYSLESKVPIVFNLERSASASAFYIMYNSKVYTITNAHVCRGEDALLLVDEVTGRDYVSLVIKISTRTDLCALSSPVYADKYELAEFSLANQPVTVIGFSGGNSQSSHKGKLGNSLKVNHILSEESCLSPPCYDPPLNVTVVKVTGITYGSSGSPVVDQTGKVVGVISLVIPTKGSQQAFMIPHSYLKDFLENLP